MRRLLSFIICFGLLAAALADAQTHTSSKRNRKKAQKRYVAAINSLRAGDIAKAKELLEESLTFDPANLSAMTARELVKQNDIQGKISEATRDLQSKQQDKAIAGFRNALALDPSNDRAQSGLSSALSQSVREQTNGSEIRYRDAEDVHIEPKDAPHDFHFKGDTRGLLEQVWNAYGVRPLIDSSVTSKQLRFDVDGADFATAITIVGQMTKTFYVPLSVNQALIFADTPENRRNFERMALRTFYIGEASSAQDINEAVAMLRTVFEFRFITPAPASSQITIRAPLETLKAATRILQDLYSGKPQIMLEFNVYQVEQTLARDLGLGIPTQFTLFNVNTEAQKLLGSGNQDLINQLISSGAINQANSSSIAALLAGLAAGGSNSILSQPIATFGGGITRSGVIVPGTSLHASLNTSSFQALDHVMLRAAQSDPATYRDGTRYPILNASFAPIFNTSAISSVLANQTFTAPFPSFSYEDLGLTLKATPTIHGSRDVSLKLEFQLRGLGATQLNGVPVITNREYNGTISVPLGETAVLAGMVSKQEQLSLQGLPGLARLPILGVATSVRNRQTDDAELLITIRPHLVRDSIHDADAGTAFVPPQTTQ
jgi:general secretion pathway protein D